MKLNTLPLLIGMLLLVFNALGQTKLEPYTPKKYNEEAHKLIEEKEDYLGAEKLFAKINENDSLYNEALYNRAVCLRVAGKIEEAFKIIDQGLELNKEYLPSFYINKASCHDSLGQYKKALTAIDEGLKRFPFNYNLKLKRGQLHESSGKYDLAMKVYQEQIVAEPLRAAGHLNLADLMYKSNGISHTVLPLTAALALNPDNTSNLGLLQLLETIVSSKPSNEGLMDLDQLDTDFEDIDALIGNYIALSDEYKIPGKIDYGFIKQLHLLLSEADESGKDFFTTNYIKIFKPFLDDRFPDFAGLLSIGSKNKNHESYISKNIESVKNVFFDVKEEYDKLSLDKDSPDASIKGKVKYNYNDAGVLDFFGQYDQKTKKFNGPMVYLSEDGAVQCRGQLNEKEEPIGNWEWFFPNGKTARKSTFVAGKLDGETTYYNDKGILLSRNQYKDNLLEGLGENYKLIGYKYEEVNYTNDKQNGTKVGFYQDGSKRYELDMKDGKENGDYTMYFDDGKVMVKSKFKDGEKDQQYITYYRDGTVSSTENHSNGNIDGKYEAFYENGQMSQEGNFKDGNRSGTWKYYNRIGNLTSIDEYDLKGKKNGISKSFDAKGRLENEYTLKKGLVESITNFDSLGNVVGTFKTKKGKLKFETLRSNGQKYRSGVMVDGKYEDIITYYNYYGGVSEEIKHKDDLKEGKSKVYYINGKIYSERAYEKGLLNGLSVFYYPNGKISRQEYYKDDLRHGRAITYTIHGVIETDNFYDGGVKNGKCKYYNTDGTIYLMEKYAFGFLESGTHYHNGEVVGSFELVNGDGVDKYYFTPEKKQLMGVNNFKGGELHGEVLRYYKNGDKRAERAYRNGKRHGDYIQYNPNGSIKKKFKYNYGEIEGEYLIYSFEGKLRYSTNYKDGLIHGESIKFNLDGSKRSVYSYKFGKLEGYSTIYIKNEVAFFLYFEDDNFVGVTYLKEDGAMADLIRITKEKKEVTTYFKSGEKSATLQYKYGTRDGKLIYYYPNGNVESEQIYVGGYENGTEKYYFEDGTLSHERNNVHGTSEGKNIYYHKNGKVKRIFPYLSDELHGQLEEFDEKGNKISTLNFVGDVLLDEL